MRLNCWSDFECHGTYDYFAVLVESHCILVPKVWSADPLKPIPAAPRRDPAAVTRQDSQIESCPAQRPETGRRSSPKLLEFLVNKVGYTLEQKRDVPMRVLV